MAGISKEAGELMLVVGVLILGSMCDMIPFIVKDAELMEGIGFFAIGLLAMTAAGGLVVLQKRK